MSEHPHMRGEDEVGEDLLTDPDGTPPHAWGRRLPEASDGTLLRDTPTCVGKTSARLRYAERTGHPHMRGEDTNLPARTGSRM